MRPKDTTPDGHAAQLAAYRRLGPSGRVRLASRMAADTRALVRAGIHTRHPEYTGEEVDFALRRVLYGDQLFRRAWPDRPLLAP